MENKEQQAFEFLKAMGIFFIDYDDDTFEDVELTIDSELILNQNDVWAWGCAMGELVKREEIPELADLAMRYGWCGILYWVSKKNNDLRSEFVDNNRFIDFVANEERIRKEEPDIDKRAYYKVSYTIGEE